MTFLGGASYAALAAGAQSVANASASDATQRRSSLQCAGRAHRFQPAFEIGQEAGGNGAVDNPMIERKTDVHYRADRDRIVIAHDRAANHGFHGDDPRLTAHENRRG